MEAIKLTQTPAVLRRLGHELSGMLHLMRHHMVFKAQEREIWICYPIIADLSRCGAALRIACKDFMFLTLEFGDEVQCRLAMDELRRARAADQLYAFVYSPASLEKNYDGWSVYDPQKEYQRMGALGDTTKWRLSTANSDFKLCATYPQHLVVPTGISDNVLAYAAKYRAKNRLPVLSYLLPLNNCSISRCSQPLAGLKQARSMQDEALISAIWSTTADPSGARGAQTDHLVVDLRPSTNAIAQVALGGGTEAMDRYRPARKVYMGVDNLHVMRDALARVSEALRHSDVGDEPPNPTSLERSGWLRHVALLVNSAKQVVQQVYYKCSHVVVHCSDGWDRTPQITSLAMLCLDPYYRTFLGFMVLVEKEWVSFGHQFATRAGFEKYQPVEIDDEPDLFKNVTQFLTESAKGRQDGPIFQQFLDCVYQLQHVFPNMFEFNERFLRRLLYHSYAAQYGTFLFDNERDQLTHDARRRTRSVWDYFLARSSQFTNPNFEGQTSDNVLVLPADWKPRWWARAFGRVDSDMNDPNAWRRPVRAPKPVADTDPKTQLCIPEPSIDPSINLSVNHIDPLVNSPIDSGTKTTMPADAKQADVQEVPDIQHLAVTS